MASRSKLFGSALLSVLGVLGALSPFTAAAQDYPNRPITLIVPLQAGGGPDTLARILADRMKISLGQPLVVENVPAAAGTVGVARLARAAPDGYTIGLGDQTTNLVSSLTYPVQYDVIADFDPIALLTTSPFVLIGRKDLPPSNLTQLIAWLAEQPARATAGTFGQGSGPHVLMSGFQSMTDTRVRLVAYRGNPQALQDIVSGQIDLLFIEQSNIVAPLQAGAIKAYGVSGATRSLALPDVPTLQEAGGPQMNISTWRGMWMPKGAPPSARERLVAAVMEALADKEVREKIALTTQEIVPLGMQMPDALLKHHSAEIEKWRPLTAIAASKLGAHAPPVADSTPPGRK